MADPLARRFGFRLAPLWLALGAALGGLACGPANDPRPLGTLDDVRTLHERSDINVLFILVDTLRADRLGMYGYARDTSPTLDALAQTGVRFAGHVAQSSWTKCSMASLWTGLYPNRAGVLRAQHALPDDARLPAEIFREEGFRTAGIFRNGWVGRNFGFSQGFELYVMPGVDKRVLADQEQNPGHVPGSDADAIRSASEFLNVHVDDRWFLYVHLLDVHQYVSDANSTLFGTRFSDIYDNAIVWTDRLVGQLIADLERLGLRERTLIVFASDHGEAFGEHGGEGHARDVYGEVTEVPFVLSFPFRLDPGIVVTARSENVDIWPTVLELLGLDPLEDTDGHSLLAEISEVEGDTRPGSAADRAFAQLDRTWGQLKEEPRSMVAVTDGPWRLVYREALPDRLELYDKVADPREQRNVAREQPGVAQRLADEAVRYLARDSAPWGVSPMIEIGEMELKQLRAIGYGVSDFEPPSKEDTPGESPKDLEEGP